MSDSIQQALDLIDKAKSQLEELYNDLDDDRRFPGLTESKAQKIAAVVWNRLGITEPIDLTEWLNNTLADMRRRELEEWRK